MKKDVSKHFKGVKEKHLRVYFNVDTLCYEVISTYEKHVIYDKDQNAFWRVQRLIDEWF